ncbi:MAG: TatD family hydrolase [Simkaniaceae bacterium]|nr:TatD family hydrolase [Simkaniaceae bacterium]MCF7851789.1 TatD family hydrolase [Simkaniaceae bacterium]
MITYIDSHLHLSSQAFIDDSEQVIERAKAAGVSRLINICTDVVTLQLGLKLSERYPMIYNAGATTPHDVEALGDKEFDAFEQAARQEKLIAIGETGLDYYYEHAPKKIQQQFLERYLLLAKELHLPVIIHCREAFDDLFSIVASTDPTARILLHCFTGTESEAKRAIEKGWRISFSGIVTFKRSEALRNVLKMVPSEHILIETDAPYLAPQSKRGQRCEPAFLRETLIAVADIKGCSLGEMASVTEKNTLQFFNI